MLEGLLTMEDGDQILPFGANALLAACLHT